MQNLRQIVYISRALFPASADPYLVEPEVADILSKSRAKNRARRLYGVLCFGDGCFLQCLQGDEKTVNEVFQGINKDTRHGDIKLLSSKNIDKKTFSRWSMKYCGVGSEMRGMLAACGHKTFDPYQFSDETIQKVIDLLQTSAESA
jgi:hypothetical protein